MSAGVEAVASAVGKAGRQGEPIPARSIPEVVWESAKRRGDAAAMWRRVDGTYQSISYREMTARVQSLAQGLAALELAPGEKLALLSENRMEWALIDMATLCLGGTTVGMFSSLPPNQVEYIVQDS